jgi:lysine biosynthesis protein LysW
MARCPECGQKLTFREGLQRWDHIYCESCHAELEVLNSMPLELEAVFEFEDDELVRGLNDDLDDDGEMMAIWLKMTSTGMRTRIALRMTAMTTMTVMTTMTTNGR